MVPRAISTLRQRIDSKSMLSEKVTIEILSEDGVGGHVDALSHRMPPYSHSQMIN